MRNKFFVLLLLFFGGCSAISLGYSYLDRIILNRLDNYLDLNSEQEAKAKPIIKEFVKWHQDSEIPAYITYLSTLQGHLKENNVKTGLEYAFAQYRVLRDRLVQRFIFKLAPFLFNASKAQQTHFFKTLDEEDEYILEYLALPQEERIKKRVADQLETLKDWIGKLTPAQKTEFTNFIKSLPDLEALRLQYHRDNQATIKKILAGRKNTEAAFINRVYSLSLPDLKSAHKYNKEWAKVTGKYFNFFNHFFQTLSKEQRGIFIEKIDALKEDIIALQGENYN